MHCSTLALTINHDLCLLGLCGFSAGDAAAVRASVIDIDPADGQDAHSYCGVRQSFTIRLSFHQAVGLGRRNSLNFSFPYAGVVQPVTKALLLLTSLPG